MEFWRKKKFWKFFESFFFTLYTKPILAKISPKIEFSWAKWLFYPIKLFLGLLLVKFYKICWSCFFAMSQKLWFWPKMAIFGTLGQIWANWEFFSKKWLCYFYPYFLPPTSCQVTGKSLELFPRSIALRTDGRTNGQGWYYRTCRFRWLKYFIAILRTYSLAYV